ncbi:MAG: histidine phosphatase family protein [Myxococcota bacterium]
MTQTLYLVRHGETEWNRERRYQGRCDSPLTSAGREQARRVGRALRELIADAGEYALVASPLGRARKTAGIVCEALGRAADACRSDPALAEMAWGDWEGRTAEEIERDEPWRWAERVRCKWSFVPPGGESYAMLAERVRRWLETVASEPPLIAITHSGFGRVLRGVHLGLTPDQVLALDGPHDTFFRLTPGRIASFAAAEKTRGRA